MHTALSSHGIKPALLREYVDTGRVIFGFKHYPLPFHTLAPAAGHAAWCASQQSKFWGMYDLLFAAAGKLQPADLQEAAGQLGIDAKTYGLCLEGTKGREHVERDRVEAERLKVPATPAFLFGNVMPDGQVQVVDTIVGARPVEAFRTVLDRLLREVRD